MSTNTPAAPVEFYNRFHLKLAQDLLAGNPRAEASIHFACDRLVESQSERILDIGCGIGWSSVEYSRARPSALVHGIDLSPVLVQFAKDAFGENSRRSFAVADVTSAELPFSSDLPYDACALLDVYEHIPAAARVAFHRSLGRRLADNAVVVLTCPTVRHQKYLRESCPAGLQPVDEDIGLSEIRALAEDLGAEITHFSQVSVWNVHDYVHVCLQRNVPWMPASKGEAVHRLLGRRQRLRAVARVARTLPRGSELGMLVRNANWPLNTFRRVVRRLAGKAE